MFHAKNIWPGSWCVPAGNEVDLDPCIVSEAGDADAGARGATVGREK
jgi:hypothetical protein